MYKFNKKYAIIITYLHLIIMLLIVMATKKSLFNALVVVIIYFLHITLHKKYCLNQFKVKEKLLLTKIYKEKILMVEILQLKD